MFESSPWEDWRNPENGAAQGGRLAHLTKQHALILALKLIFTR